MSSIHWLLLAAIAASLTQDEPGITGPDLSQSSFPPPVLGEIAAAKLVNANRAIVLDRSDNRVHLVDARGNAIAVTGRRGAGPGEYLVPERIVRLDDSTFGVTDRATARLTALRLRRDSLVMVASFPIHGHFYDVCRSGRSYFAAATGADRLERIEVLDERFGLLRTIAPGRPFESPFVRAAYGEGRLACLAGGSVVIAEVMGPWVAAYDAAGVERWRTELPMHRSVQIEATATGTRYRYRPDGNHGAIEVVDLGNDRIAVSLGIAFLGPPQDTATLRGTVYELVGSSGAVVAQRDSPQRLRDAMGPLQLWDMEDPEPRVEIRRVR